MKKMNVKAHYKIRVLGITQWLPVNCKLSTYRNWATAFPAWRWVPNPTVLCGSLRTSSWSIPASLSWLSDL